ncbi:MAG TPA: hypothetical protein VHG70_18230 [Nocardioidaceae bacterium]|nr:hypothetical protein [Nocardioidaceae bacterium]
MLGPLHVDLLGLVTDLNQVNLTITAEQGPATCSATCCARSPACSTVLTWAAAFSTASPHC